MDLVDDNVFTKFGLNWSIRFEDMYEEDPNKNDGARVVTTLYSNISDAQGQITLVLVSVTGRNLNSSKLSCMSSLPARMRMIDSKMKELECSQDFSHIRL